MVPKLFLGIFANRLYLHQAKRKIASVTQDPVKRRDKETEIEAAGGTNLLLPLAVLVLPGLLAVAVGLTVFLRTYAGVDKQLEQAAAARMPEESRAADSLNMPSKGTLSAPSASASPTADGMQDRMNILLLGGDSRQPNEVGSSDSIMVVSLDPATKHISLFSILRDTYVNIRGYGDALISRAWSIGGAGLAVETAEEWTGLPIDCYVYTDLQGFVKLIDQLGGIDMDVEKNMNYADSNDPPMYDIHLKKGYQHMDGLAALQYVRFRHDATSDFTRTERQRKLVQAVARELLSSTSAAGLPGLVRAVEPYVQTDIGFEDMLKLGRLGLGMDLSGIDSIQLPPMELLKEKPVNGKSVLVVDDPGELHSYIKNVLAGNRDE
ncbi:Regulatory protein MsrR [compost metagenome]